MKLQRQSLILDIVRRLPVANQENLVVELARQGVETNQATVSRDIKSLGLVKVPDPTVGHRYALPDGAGPRPGWDAVWRTLREHATSVDHAEHLIVIKTPPGRAHLVAVVLDLLDTPDIVGTLAGDDTLLVVPRDRVVLQALMGRFKQAFSAEPRRLDGGERPLAAAVPRREKHR